MLWIERLSTDSKGAAASVHGSEIDAAKKSNAEAADTAEKHLRLGMEKVTDLLICLPRSRKHEHEADLIGLKLAAIAGYPLTAGVHAMSALDSYARGNHSLGNIGGGMGAVATRVESYVSTHPPDQYRIDKMRQEIEEMEKRLSSTVGPAGWERTHRFTADDEVMRRVFVTT